MELGNELLRPVAEILPRVLESLLLAILKRAGYASPVRRPRGRDILAACGQLKSESEKLSASERRRQAAISTAN